jgi:predicted nucleic acid-binding protein
VTSLNDQFAAVKTGAAAWSPVPPEVDLSTPEAEAALADLRALDLQRHSHEPLLETGVGVAGHLSASDAVYVALAEALDGVLLTCDARFARATGISARIELIAPRTGRS